MNTTRPETMSPNEQAVFTAVTERLKQLRRRRGVPNGVSLTDAVALHMITSDEVENARWGGANASSARALASPS